MDFNSGITIYSSSMDDEMSMEDFIDEIRYSSMGDTDGYNTYDMHGLSIMF